MKRSEINKALKELENMVKEYRYFLPKFCDFTPEEWKTKGHEWDEVRDNMLGWDITDYGSGEFDKVGFSLITIRNGNQKQQDKYPKPYAEKLMVVKEGQVTPMHFHTYKMEDIINRGGGNLMITLYNSTEDGGLADTAVTVSVDGARRSFAAGSTVRLTPGESITLTQGLYHRFFGEVGCGTVLVGEVSMCNDDSSDNRFYDEVGRFPEIEEDEEPVRLLCNEYLR